MIKNIIRLCLGSGLAQGLQLLALPVLSYLYTPGAMGVYFFVISLSTIISVLFSLQLHQSIPNQKSDESVGDIVKSIGVLFTLIYSFILVAVFITSFENRYLFVWAGLFSLTSLSIATLRMILTREGDFRSLNFLMLIRSLMIIVGQTFCYFIDEQRGLMIGFMFGEIVAIVSVLFLLKNRRFLVFTESFSMKETIKKNKDFVYFGVPQELIAVLTLGLPIIIINHIYGEEASGQFGMAQRLIFPVATILLGAIINTLQNHYGTQEKYLLFASFSFKKILVALGILIVVIPIVYFGSGIFVSLILSSDWNLAIEISKYVSLWAIALVISAPFRASCKIYSLQFLLLMSDIIIFMILLAMYIFRHWINIEFIFLVKLFIVLGVFQNLLVILNVSYYVKRDQISVRKNS